MVKELFQRELGNIFLHELDFPYNTLVTVLDVEIPPNLQTALVYITITPAENSPEVFALLHRNIFAIQQRLNKRLKMRPIPKIRFATGESASKAQRVEELLDRIAKKP